MQNWEKLGLIYQPKGVDFTHAAVPLAFPLGDVWKIFFTARNKENQSLPFSLILDPETLKVSNVDESPLLLSGRPGEFDSDGVMPTCWLLKDDLLYLFYVGWNKGVDVPFRNALGMAVSKDRGKTFIKAFDGPVLDRSIYDPSFVGSCDIMQEDDHFRMWYLSALKWEKTDNQWRHYYHIKYARSNDLMVWERNGHVSIDFSEPSEYAISTPRVLKRNSGFYSMWYSYRGWRNKTYRIGYAESGDGLDWIRRDDEVYLPLSKHGWDSEMICYPYLFLHKENLYMLYNGNNYGKTGFGLALLKT
jgi:hypothetical protein